MVVDALKIVCDARPSGWDLSKHDDASALEVSSVRAIMNVLANSVNGFLNLISSDSQTQNVGTKSGSGRAKLLENGAFNYPTLPMINQVRHLVVPKILRDLDEKLSAHNLVIHHALDKTALGDDAITMSCHTVSVVQRKRSCNFELDIGTVTTDFEMVWDGKDAADIRSLIQRLVRPDQPLAVDVDEIMAMLRPVTE